MKTIIRKATEQDVEIIAKLAIQMWETQSIEELAQDFFDEINQKSSAIFLAFVDDSAVGFAQCGLRHDYVEGTESFLVGYLEGILVEEAYRKKGLARDLLGVCEQWAREQGCTEFASDCELVNEESLKFHLRMGFEEANRIICFTKKLQDPVIGRVVTVTVDRPLGSYHPKHSEMYYPVNYGYVEGIMAPDGEEQDAYILGVDEKVDKFMGRIIAIVHRNDDIEKKWIVVPEGVSFTKEEIKEKIHFQEQYFDSYIVM